MQHNTLIPEPMKLDYKSGVMQLSDICITSNQNEKEDIFAVKYLADAVKNITGTKAANECKTCTRCIVLNRTSDLDALSSYGEATGADGAQAYKLICTPDKIEISSKSSAGVFFGVQTLIQLIENEDGKFVVPCVEIEDWPALPFRSVMMDVSHTALSTVEEIKRQLDFLAKWKFNQYFLYSECQIELDGYPLIMPDGRYTKGEIREIIAYGKELHIDVIPNLDLYGHTSYISRVEKYSDMFIYSHGPEFNPLKESTKQFVADWVEQISELFESEFVHIGFDETWCIEQMAQKENTTPAKLFTEQLKNVANGFMKNGKKVLFWADIPVHYPDIMKEIGEGLIPVAWEYDAIPNTKKFLDPLVELGFEHFIQSGVSNWREVGIDFEETHSNIANFVVEGRKSGTLGLIHSVWNDSQTTLLRMAFPTMAFAGIASWQDKPICKVSFWLDYAKIMYPNAPEEMADALRLIDLSENELQKVFGQPTFDASWENPFLPHNLEIAKNKIPELRQCRLYAEEAFEKIYYANKKGVSKDLTDCFVFASRRLDYTAFRYMIAYETVELWNSMGKRPEDGVMWGVLGSQITCRIHGRVMDMMDEISAQKELLRKNWLNEYTDFRLATALGLFDCEQQFWLNIQWKLKRFESRYDRSTTDMPNLLDLINN